MILSVKTDLCIPDLENAILCGFIDALGQATINAMFLKIFPVLVT